MPDLAVYAIPPMPKPRMTKRDAYIMRRLASRQRMKASWAKRAELLSRWLVFKDQVKLLRVTINPDEFYHLVFCIPTPKSAPGRAWKRHQLTPDKDNLEKALLDAMFADDKKVWDGRVSKVWAPVGAIIISRDNIKLSRESLEPLIKRRHHNAKQ